MNELPTLSMKQIAETLYESQKHTDVDFIFGEGSEYKIISAHQIIISLSSKFWKDKFYPSGWKKTLKSRPTFAKVQPRLTFQIAGISLPIFETILKYCYGKDLQLTRLNAPQLLKTADQFQMRVLSRCCEEFLIGQLESKELINAFPFATKYLLTITQSIFENTKNNTGTRTKTKIIHGHLKNSITDFVYEHEVKFWKQERLLCNITEETALFLLEIPRIQIRETFIYYRIIERAFWLNLQDPRSLKRRPKNTNDTNSLKQILIYHRFIQKLIPLIRLDNVQIEENKPIIYKNILYYLKSLRKKQTKQYENSKLKNKELITNKTKVKFTENENLDDDNSFRNYDENRESLVGYDNGDDDDDDDYGNGTNSQKYSTKKDHIIKKGKKRIRILKRHNFRTRSSTYNQNALEPEEQRALFITTEISKSRKKDIWKSLVSGGFKNVNIFDAYKYQLNYSLLEQFDAVFVYSIAPWRNDVHVGDLLAKYLINGGGVVICAPFCLKSNETKNDPVELKGRISEPDVLPMAKGKLGDFKISKLEKILRRKHPIMKGVNSFVGGKYSYRIIPQNIDKYNGSSSIYNRNGDHHLDDERFKKKNDNSINTISTDQNSLKSKSFKEYIPPRYSLRKHSRQLPAYRKQQLNLEANKEKKAFEEMGFDEITREKCLEIGKTRYYWEFLQKFSKLFPNQIIFNDEENNKIIKFPQKWIDIFSHCKSMKRKRFITSLIVSLKKYQFYLQQDSEYYLFTDNEETSIKRKKKKGENTKMRKGGIGNKEELEKVNRGLNTELTTNNSKNDNYDPDNQTETKKKRGGEGQVKRKEKEKSHNDPRFYTRKRSLNQQISSTTTNKSFKIRRKSIHQKLNNFAETTFELSNNQLIEENSRNQNSKTISNLNTNDNDNFNVSGNENENENNKKKKLSYIPTEMFAGESIIIAEWNRGIPLIIEKKFLNKKLGKLIVLNFLPVSESAYHNNGFRWRRHSDGKQIIANSLKYVLRNK
ncbi:btb (poz) domain-containing 2a-related [Anaeramoeba flamelloides]|uniref:Btb (Poz) domain-containing 2a-related n=1 Tax=Anaeramoeba flamelloides TaxID=1746091 RepID=A0AAV7YB92_9EUKA|nr:btb (poz) domain-containing 2a-related [Anaeramoeba flamelloides]